MIDKLKNIFQEKDDKKKTDNLVAFLIILVVTLILINKILKSDSGSKEGIYQNQAGIELVNNKQDSAVLLNDNSEDELERKLENILSKIDGVRES